MTDTTPRRRRRDPEGHRQAILGAARAIFGEQGYAGTTIRAVAGRAGVTHGLVMRQFGCKEQLFLAAMPGHRDLDQVVTGDAAGLPGRVARAYVERMESDAAGDPLVALLRGAAANQEAAAALLAAMESNSVEAYAAVLTGPDVPERVAMLGACLIGVTFTRYIARTGPLAAMDPAALTTHLERALRHILFSD